MLDEEDPEFVFVVVPGFTGSVAGTLLDEAPDDDEPSKPGSFRLHANTARINILITTAKANIFFMLFS